MHPLLQHICPNSKPSVLNGGDINQVFKLENNKIFSVIKINDRSDFPDMFDREVKGLQLLSNAFVTPQLIKVGEYENWQYLHLEYIQSVVEDKLFWQQFGHQLAELHQTSNPQFGLDHSNYIGSLIQTNIQHEKWEEFLINERLAPMIEMAVNSGEVNYVESKMIEKYYQRINEIYPLENPSLLHGDLWSGNYVSSENGAVLIDPAVYFGHREMEIGMMKLFGGFDQIIFDSYNELYPLEKDWKERITYNQIYPLLVHLNLFGRSYWSQIERILRQFL